MACYACREQLIPHHTTSTLHTDACSLAVGSPHPRHPELRVRIHPVVLALLISPPTFLPTTILYSRDWYFVSPSHPPAPQAITAARLDEDREPTEEELAMYSRSLAYVPPSPALPAPFR